MRLGIMQDVIVAELAEGSGVKSAPAYTPEDMVKLKPAIGSPALPAIVHIEEK